MNERLDEKDRYESRKILVAMSVLLVVALVALALMMPLVSEFSAVYLEPGLGLKSAAVIAFFVTVILMIVFAVSSGDGLLGELQFMLVGFFAFFLLLWLSIAWIF